MTDDERAANIDDEKLKAAVGRVTMLNSGIRAKVVYGFDDGFKMDDFDYRMLENRKIADLKALADDWFRLSAEVARLRGLVGEMREALKAVVAMSSQGMPHTCYDGELVATCRRCAANEQKAAVVKRAREVLSDVAWDAVAGGAAKETKQR